MMKMIILPNCSLNQKPSIHPPSKLHHLSSSNLVELNRYDSKKVRVQCRPRLNLKFISNLETNIVFFFFLLLVLTVNNNPNGEEGEENWGDYSIES